MRVLKCNFHRKTFAAKFRKEPELRSISLFVKIFYAAAAKHTFPKRNALCKAEKIGKST